MYIQFTDELNKSHCILCWHKTSYSVPCWHKTMLSIFFVLQERFQLYIVVYDYNANQPRGHFAVDRLLIDIDLGPAPAVLSRLTYTGIYNISSFDISFNVTCKENFYGPDCNIACDLVSSFCPCGGIEGNVKVN